MICAKLDFSFDVKVLPSGFWGKGNIHRAMQRKDLSCISGNCGWGGSDEYVTRLEVSVSYVTESCT